jgi:hypothetical protein
MPSSRPLDLTLLSLDERLEELGLHLNSPEAAVLCVHCKFALKPTGDRVTRHLGEKHNVPNALRAWVSQYIRSLKLSDPSKLAPRPDGSPYHPHLAVSLGAACKHCDYRTTSTDLLGRHLVKSHGRKRKSSSWMRDDVIEGVLLQSWVQSGTRGFWIVDRNASVEGVAEELNHACLNHAALASTRTRVEQMHKSERERLVDRRLISLTDVGSEDLSLTSNWMRRTGWAEMFTNANRELLVRLTDLPSYTTEHSLCLGSYDGENLYSSTQDEGKLLHIMDALDRAFDCCEDTVRHTDISLRCWLQGQYPDRPYKAPFQLVGRQSTTSTYRRLMKRAFCFCLRFWRLDADVRQALLNRSPTRNQHKALMEVWSNEIWSRFPSTTTTSVLRHQFGSTIGYDDSQTGDEAMELDDIDSENASIITDSEDDENDEWCNLSELSADFNMDKEFASVAESSQHEPSRSL